MTDTTELLRISKELEQLIDQSANIIFNQFHEHLLERENTYIIPAVWGGMENGQLDDTQNQIHQIAKKLVENGIIALNIDALTDPQVFAIRYLINRCLIYTMTFKIETTKNMIAQKKMEAAELLKNLPPSGTA